MREMIMTEICGVLGDTVSRAADRLNGVKSDGRHSTKTIRGVVSSFRHLSVSRVE